MKLQLQVLPEDTGIFTGTAKVDLFRLVNFDPETFLSDNNFETWTSLNDVMFSIPCCLGIRLIAAALLDRIVPVSDGGLG